MNTSLVVNIYQTDYGQVFIGPHLATALHHADEIRQRWWPPSRFSGCVKRADKLEAEIRRAARDAWHQNLLLQEAEIVDGVLEITTTDD